MLRIINIFFHVYKKKKLCELTVFDGHKRVFYQSRLTVFNNFFNGVSEKCSVHTPCNEKNHKK